MFIDIREKEKKRGVRGLVTVPTNSKYDNLLAAAAANESDPMAMVTATASNADDGGRNNGGGGGGGGVNAEDLLELQEKITKEILSSKLQESDMQELQVCYSDYSSVRSMKICKL